MREFAFAYWWLIFPAMWFVFAFFGMWMHHRRQTAALELMKTYAEKGRDPAEISKMMNAGDPGYGYPRYGFLGRGYWRYGPYWAWRKAIMSACVAAGFWFAAWYFGYGDFPFGGGFEVVAVIMTVIAAGSLLFALGTSLFPSRTREI